MFIYICLYDSDIAARNCLYDDRNQVIKISDFGLSREGKEFKMTTTQRVPVRSIAPECLTTFTFSRASDVFSFGVLLWEIYTDGAKPFDGIKTSEIKDLVGFFLHMSYFKSCFRF